MQNIELNREDGKLVIAIDLSKEFGKSKSGKTVIVASTQGNVDVGDGIKLGVNAYKAPSVV